MQPSPTLELSSVDLLVKWIRQKRQFIILWLVIGVGLLMWFSLTQHFLAAVYGSLFCGFIGFAMSGSLYANILNGTYGRNVRGIVGFMGLALLASCVSCIATNSLIFVMYPYEGLRWTELVEAGFLLHLGGHSIGIILQQKMTEPEERFGTEPESKTRAFSSVPDLVEPTSDRLLITDSKRVHLVDPLKISFIEADGDYIKVHTADSSHLVRKKISSMEDELDDRIFQRVHRSYLVNLRYIKALRNNQNGDYIIELTTGKEIKMSRSYNHIIQSHLGRSI